MNVSQQIVPALQSKTEHRTSLTEKAGDFIWAAITGAFRMSFLVETSIDMKARPFGDRVFRDNLSKSKNPPDFTSDDVGEFFALLGKGAYFGIPSLAVIYFLGFFGVLLCFLLFAMYLFFRARYLREKDAGEIKKTESPMKN